MADEQASSTIPTSPFDAIRKVDEHGNDYWSARDLARLLGYTEYGKFKKTLQKARRACQIAKQNFSEHFRLTHLDALLGKGGRRKIEDYCLSIYALHLILTFSDLKKPEIFQAISYFTIASLERSKNYYFTAKALDISIPPNVPITQEQETIGQIKKAFCHLRLIQQYRAAQYRIDLYLPDYKIAVECDEGGHKRYDRAKDMKRQRYLEQKLDCTFVRYNPDAFDFNIGDVIHQIMMLVYGNKERI